MVSVVIFCHDKGEADFFEKLCGQCTAFIKNEFLQSSILSDENYNKTDIERLTPADLIIVEIMNPVDLKRAKYMRSYFPSAKMMVLSNVEVSPECYLVPELSPDMLLLKPYIYSRACRFLHRIFSWFYRERCEERQMKKLLTIQTGGEFYYFNYKEIYYLESKDKKIVLHMHQYEFPFYGSLRKLEESLPDYFIRCHRSYIVNFMFIQKVDLPNGLFYLDKKTVIPISQKYKAKLAKMLQKYKDSEGKLG